MNDWMNGLRVVCLSTALFLVATNESRAQNVQHFGSLPYNSNPGDPFFQGQDGNFYGVLWETNLPTPASKNGAIYRLSPQGEFRYLYQFPYVETLPAPNATGIQATDYFCMGSDGSLYGITEWGGAYGWGVFFRFSLDGVYEVISSFETRCLMGIGGPLGFIEGPDHAFYIIPWNWSGSWSRQVLRLGLDGSQTSIGNTPLANWSSLVCPSMEGNCIAMVAPDTATGSVKIRYVEVPSGNTLSEKAYTAFPPNVQDINLIELTGSTMLLATTSINPGQNQPGQLVNVALDSGSATVISEFSLPFTAGYPPFQIMYQKDGGVYYSAGAQTRGILGRWTGSKLYYIPPGGTAVQVCDFDGFPLIAMTTGRDGVVYGVSWGEAVIDESSPSAIQPSMANLMITPSLTSMARATSASTLSKHGAFRLAKPGTPLNLAPVAKTDVVTLKRLKSLNPPVKIPVLKNDFDPEKSLLTLTEVGATKFGTVAITNDSKGGQEITYTPGVFPSRSERISYQIADSHGQTSIGQILIRGDLGGRYNNPSGSSAPFTMGVSSNGSFSASIKVSGTTYSFTGYLDYAEAAYVQKRLKSGAVTSLKISMETNGDNRGVDYEFKQGAQLITGSAVRD